MVEKRKNLIVCLSCRGDSDGCLSCFDTGKMEIGWVELHDDNVFDSYKILEEIDSTEYNSLTDAQKDNIKMLLSCGFVDLNDGRFGKTTLWNTFGAESTTVANLSTLLE